MMAEKLRGYDVIQDAIDRGLMKADENGHFVAVEKKAPEPRAAPKKEEPALKVVGDMPARKKDK